VQRDEKEKWANLEIRLNYLRYINRAKNYEEASIKRVR